MGLESTNTIDAIGLDKLSGCATLSIVDSWNWELEEEHLTALADKINSYLGFIESGELIESYPPALGRPIEICIIGKYPLSSSGHALIQESTQVALSYNVRLLFRQHP